MEGESWYVDDDRLPGLDLGANNGCLVRGEEMLGGSLVEWKPSGYRPWCRTVSVGDGSEGKLLILRVSTV